VNSAANGLPNSHGSWAEPGCRTGIRKENIDLDNVTQDGNHGNESPQAGESPTEYVAAETYNTNMVPSGPEGDAANDVTVTPVTGTGGVPVCDIPAFGPPAA